jgi:hypothetical protein
LTGALEIAEELGDRDYQLRSLRGLHLFCFSSDIRGSSRTKTIG